MLLDSNIIIYISQKKDFGDFLEGKIFSASAISKLEVLGFHNLNESDKKELDSLFQTILLLPINENIIDKAISFRQTKRMSLGDSIIAATALVHKLPLVTANTSDFKWIENLELINPLG